MRKKTAEGLQQKFRVFAQQNFGCRAINPRNRSESCTHALRHEGPHSWSRAEVQDDLPGYAEFPAAPEEPKPERVGTWTRKLGGVWCVRISGATTGDTVLVRSKSGEVHRVLLGEQVMRGVFNFEQDFGDEKQREVGEG